MTLWHSRGSMTNGTKGAPLMRQGERWDKAGWLILWRESVNERDGERIHVAQEPVDRHQDKQLSRDYGANITSCGASRLPPQQLPSGLRLGLPSGARVPQILVNNDGTDCCAWDGQLQLLWHVMRSNCSGSNYSNHTAINNGLFQPSKCCWDK